MNFDFENIKIIFEQLIYKKRKMILIFLYSVIFIFISFGLFFYKQHLKKVESSNDLINYIYGKDEEFLEKEHKNGYAIIKKLILNKKNPKQEVFDEFQKYDDYLFNDLFLFAKRLTFNIRENQDPFYLSEQSMWNSLFLICNIFYGDYESFYKLKNKENYIIQFIVGKGEKCSK